MKVFPIFGKNAIIITIKSIFILLNMLFCLEVDFMYISKLKIRNYKNFYKCNVDLKNDITTIIGENGTGKTNIFYALRQLLDKNNRHFLDVSDFSYELDNPNGHWIIISAEFKEVPNSDEIPEAVSFNPDESNNATYSLIFRPNRIIRNKLYNLSKEYFETSEEENKNIKKMEINEFINNIDVKNDYEIKKTVGNIFDFTDDDKYKEIIGDFDNYIFPSPDDFQDDSAQIGDRDDSDLTRFINVTFIPAIRDVNSELIKDGNFFEKMLGNISEGIDESTWSVIKQNFNTINEQLKNIDEFTKLTGEIFGMMNNTVGASFSGDMFLDVSVPEDKNKVIKYFTLKGKIENHSIDLYNKSLGENNIIYFALKMLQNNYYNGHTKRLFNLLIIEEPESHLHKHLQQTFLTGIEKTYNTQILLSTHSVHISEACNISSMIILGKKSEKSCELYVPSNKLSEEDIKYLERYLDSIRTPILFSKSVLLVEGTAELIFIDNILKLKYNFDLNAYGISLISMDNCFFEKISKLFHSDRLRKKCSIITDLDKDFDGSQSDKEKLSKNRVENLNMLHTDNKFVRVYTNDYTFEIELYSNNLELLKKYVKDRKIYTKNIEDILKELDESTNDIIKYRRILLIANKIGKGWLSLDFIEWLKEQDKNLIDKIVIPNYIIEALKNFFPSDGYNKNIYNQIVTNFCKKMECNEDLINDNFISYIKGIKDEE